MEDIIQFFKQKAPGLTEAHLEKIMQLGKLQFLDRGEVFVQQGSLSKRFGIVLQGLMRTFIRKENGSEITVLFSWEKKATGSHSAMVLNKPSTEIVEAIEPTTLIVIDFVESNKLAATDLVFSRFQNNFLVELLSDNILRVEDFTLRNPEERYLRLLHEFPVLLQRAPQKHLASYLGITPISLSRLKNRIAKRRS